MDRRQSCVNAITPESLEAILKHYQLWDSFLRGELRCAVTGEVITSENLANIKKVGDDLIFYSIGALTTRSA